jgi:hypothetical protein
MKRTRFIYNAALVVGSLIFCLASVSADSGLPVPDKLVALADASGQDRLLDTDYKQSFWSLIGSFETQKNQAYCAVASSVTVLNAMGISRPKTERYPDFPYFTQEEFFRQIDPKIAEPSTVAKEGMTLQQVADALAAFPIKVERNYASDLKLEEFRKIIRDTTGTKGRFALVNFDRKVVGEVGGGHWSPIAAYHPKTDSVLVLDVARYKYPPLWIPTELLHRAAQSVDTTSNRSRGLVLLTK